MRHSANVGTKRETRVKPRAQALKSGPSYDYFRTILKIGIHVMLNAFTSRRRFKDLSEQDDFWIVKNP